ncbi:MAG: efflux transporter outer membrane subunit [Planctomycetota bacterium]
MIELPIIRHLSIRVTKSVVAVALVSVLLPSCAVGPDYSEPALEVPEHFSSELGGGLVSGAIELREWWRTLGDSTLDSLIQRALQNNLDLEESLSRIQEARARRGVARTDLLPRFDATGDYQRNQLSKETALGPVSPRSSSEFFAGVEASWELDIWGRNRRLVESATADVQASVEEARAVLILVLAETALSYVELRSLQERLRIARSNVDLQQQTVELTESKFAANLVSKLDVAQARSSHARAQSTVPTLEAAAQAVRNRLSVLLGLYPGELEAELSNVVPIPVPPASIAVGVPANIVRQRPDIRRAERQLAAQTARIGVARGDLYPRLTLSGTLGFGAENASDLFSGDASLFGLGPSVVWNLFDRGRIHSNISAEEARATTALLDYRRTVLLAVEEIENAMASFSKEQISRDSLVVAVEEARDAVRLSRDQYRLGLVSFQSVIDTQTQLFVLEDRLAAKEALITTELIVLFTALGGGWESRDVTLEPAESTDRERP